MLRPLLLAVLLLSAPSAVRAADWTPNAWADQSTIDLTTLGQSEGPHTFPVWLVVIDGQVYVRLGSRAADRFEHSMTKPSMGVSIAGASFPKVKGEPAPEMREKVAAAMAQKYWSDVLVRHFDHPLTLRLVPE
jgi:hypothetical protein